MLGQGAKALDLPKLYRYPFDTTKEVKLVMFQFKINHNIVYTKDKLMKAKWVPVTYATYASLARIPYSICG